mmetsp:Transcript_64848/g.145729  ORF Transcript_64848/g.145729 Transcript_64848/m.145729 type:complete len:320 (+) Transcript_64848:446-1405(+)
MLCAMLCATACRGRATPAPGRSPALRRGRKRRGRLRAPLLLQPPPPQGTPLGQRAGAGDTVAVGAHPLEPRQSRRRVGRWRPQLQWRPWRHPRPKQPGQRRLQCQMPRQSRCRNRRENPRSGRRRPLQQRSCWRRSLLTPRPPRPGERSARRPTPAPRRTPPRPPARSRMARPASRWRRRRALATTRARRMERRRRKTKRRRRRRRRRRRATTRTRTMACRTRCSGDPGATATYQRCSVHGPRRSRRRRRSGQRLSGPRQMERRSFGLALPAAVVRAPCCLGASTPSTTTRSRQMASRSPPRSCASRSWRQHRLHLAAT